MSSVLNALLGLLAIPILILPLGKLRDKRVSAYWGFTSRGIWFYISILLLTGITLCKEYLSNREESVKEMRDVEMQSTVSSIDLKLQKFDSLEHKLNEIASNTLKSIDERERALVEFNKISDKIKQITEEDKQSIEKDRADLVFERDPYFVLNDSLQSEYRLNVPVKNIGGRTAYNFKVTAVAFQNLNGVIKKIIDIPLAANPESTVPPYKKTNGWTNVHYYTSFSNATLETLKYGIYLFISIEYFDAITNKKYPLKNCYTWKGYLKDKRQFYGSSMGDYNIVLDYIKKNNIRM